MKVSIAGNTLIARREVVDAKYYCLIGGEVKTIHWGNPYTHEEHERTCYTKKDFPVGNFTCDWCGQERKRLYSYGPTLRKSKIFCNKECWESYYE